jgi:hypothetical protein
LHTESKAGGRKWKVGNQGNEADRPNVSRDSGAGHEDGQEKKGPPRHDVLTAAREGGERLPVRVRADRLQRVSEVGATLDRFELRELGEGTGGCGQVPWKNWGYSVSSWSYAV